MKREGTRRSCRTSRTLKKSKCDLGGFRGRKISASDRREAITLIDEAVISGARLSEACKALGITERTYYRWLSLDKQYGTCEDRRKFADHSNPANKLSPNLPVYNSG